MNRPILISGIPRTGSTWLAEALVAGTKALYIKEPDNERSNLLIYEYKRNLHRYPYLRKHEASDLYQELWRLSFQRVKLKKFLKLSYKLYICYISLCLFK